VLSEQEKGQGAMRSSALLAAAMLAAILTAGCTTSGIDTLETAALGADSRDISAADLREGRAQFMAANYGLAEKHFRKAVELRASNAEAWLGLAAAYDQLGRFDFADRAYDQLLKLAGRRPQIVNNMGYSHLLRGDKAKARKLLFEAKAALPDDPLVAANLALLERS
jgi:Flp pilus assembly protein TadD